MKACLECGEPTRFGRARCPECLTRAALAHARVYSERLTLGLCPTCGGQPKPGRKQCQACRDRLNANHRAWRTA